MKVILSKCIGTRTPTNLVRATVDALQQLRMPEDVAALRGKTVTDVLGPRLQWSAETGHVGVSAKQWEAQQGGALSVASTSEVAAAHEAHDAEVEAHDAGTAVATETTDAAAETGSEEA